MSWSFLDFTGLSRFFGRLPEKLVTTDTTQTISGTKSFSSTILGSVSGSAASASKDGAGNVIADTYETKEDAATHLSKSDAAGTYLSKTDAASTCVQTGAVDQTIAGTKTFSKPIVGSVTGSSGSCTGNAASANIATKADSATKAANADHATSADSATKATQDAAGNTITTTYATKAENNIKANNSEVVHKSGDETIAGTKTFSNEVLLTYPNALMAQYGGYTLLLRNDGSTTCILMSDKGGVPGTWTDARPLMISNSTGVCSINGNAGSATNATYANWLRTSSHSDHLFHIEWDGVYFWTYVTAGDGGYRAVRVERSDSSGNADTATKLATARTIALSGAATGTATAFDGSGNITIPVTSLDASKLTGTASVSTTGNAATATKAVRADHATSADSATRATSADRASVANCVQSQAQTSVYHEIRFDWDSQVPDHVGLRVDATDMGGIVTTDRLVSDIRAQWYAAYPDGPEAHNAMWGGRDITAAFDSGEFSEHIANGSFKDIFPGDYITKSVTISGKTYTVNWVVADCDYWINKGDTATTAHHVVIVPQASIFNANMNDTNTTEGGYAGSRMYKNVIPACATGIVNAFGSSHILTFRDGITNSVDTSHVSSGIPQWTGTPGWWGVWVSAQCNLMSEKMVYGAPICAAGAMDNSVATRQMSAFRLSERLINYNRWGWWLRDVVSSANFAVVDGGGDAATYDASAVIGVRPFTLLV